MSKEQELLDMARQNHGVLTSEQVTKAGIHRQYLKRLLDTEQLEQPERGIYILPATIEDELFNIQNRHKRGIYSHETALFLLGLTDRTPLKYAMTFPLNYNTSNLNNDRIQQYRVKDELYLQGLTMGKSPGGNFVRYYNAERTLCDILKGRSKTGIEIISEAFKNYTSSGKMNIPLLSEYAKIMRVEKKLRPYLEVLL